VKGSLDTGVDISKLFSHQDILIPRIKDQYREDLSERMISPFTKTSLLLDILEEKKMNGGSGSQLNK